MITSHLAQYAVMRVSIQHIIRSKKSERNPKLMSCCMLSNTCVSNENDQMEQWSCVAAIIRTHFRS